jgi:hypothetical protein
LPVVQGFYFSFSFWRLFISSGDAENEDAPMQEALHLLRRNKSLKRDRLYPEAPHRNNLLGDPRVKDTYTRLWDLALEIQAFCRPRDTIMTRILLRRLQAPIYETVSHWQARHMKER